MTKEQILNGMSEAEFYSLYPTKEDYLMANGGNLSGAPHNGQPTANQFFNFGASTNLNIPFGNFAYGGIPCMDCGGYMQEGGNPNFMDTINGITKANRKTFKSGSTIQGGANNDIGQTRISDFKGTLATNAHNALLKEEQQKILQQFTQGRAQYGGDPYAGQYNNPYGPQYGINYEDQPNDQLNLQNLAIQGMYQQHLDQSSANLQNDAGNLFQGIADMNSPENMKSSTKITQARYGMPVGPNFKGGLTPEQQYMLKMMSKFVPGNAKDNTAGTTAVGTNNGSPKYVGNQQQSSQKQSTANIYLQEYYNKRFGPWGKTHMVFGTNNPNTQGYNTSQNQTQNTTQSYTGDPSKRPYQHLNDDQLFQLNAATMDAPSNESWFSKWKAVQQDKRKNKVHNKKYKPANSAEETQTGINNAVYDYEKDMPDEYIPKPYTGYDPDAPVSEKFGGPIYQFGAQVEYDQFGNPIDPNKQMMKRNTFGSNATDNAFGTNNIFKGDGTRNTFGTPKPKDQNNQGAQGNSQFSVDTKYGPSLTGPAAASTIIAGVNTAASLFEKRDDKAFKEKMNQMTLADNAFVNSPINSQSRGDYDPNSGMFRVDQHVPLRWNGYRFKQDGGETDLPIAKDGFNMKAGLYGTNGNRQFSLPMNTQAFSKAPVSVRQTLEPVDREDANLEAEKGETAILDVGGIPAHFNIGGKKHSAGGTPLSLPDDSFIFSDTKGMLIKDPIMLAQFGMVPTKAGYTPADIAKKFDINKFRKILANPDSEALEVKTAEMMIANYNMKLAKLALLQESMKGFPQGIPKIAMPYIDATGLNPAELIGGPNQTGVAQMDPNMIPVEQGQEDMPDQDMGVARYGGLMKAQNGGGMTHAKLDSMERQTLAAIEKYRNDGEEVPAQIANNYNNIQKIRKTLGAQEPVKQSANSSWVTSDGKPIGKVDQNSTGYLDRIAQHWGNLSNIEDLDINTLNKVANNEIPIPKGGLKVQTVPQQNLKKMWQNVNPFDSHPTEGAWDYTKKLVGAPLKLVNTTLTGNVETPGTTYIRTHEGARVMPFMMDVATDPLTYVGPKVIKEAGKAAYEGVKQLPKVAAWARYLVPEWGTAIKEFAIHYGPKVAEQITKALKVLGPAAQNIGPSALTKFISTDYGDIETLMRNGEKVDQETVDKMIKEAVEREKQKQKQVTASTPDSLLVKKPVVKKDSVSTEEDWSKYEVK